MKKNCGIYKFICLITNKIYIGQSTNLSARYSSYKKNLGKGQNKLHYSMLKYGFGNHRFEVVCYCNSFELDRLEIYYGDLYKVLNPEKGLNIKELGISGRHSEETRKKMAIIRTGRKASNETILKLSQSLRGKKRSMDVCKKMSEMRKGKSSPHKGKKNRYSKETLIKMSESRKGKRDSIETIEKKRKRVTGELNPMFGKTHTLSAKRKISMANKGRILSEEHKEAFLNGARRPKSEEHKNKISQANKGKLKSQEHKNKLSESRSIPVLQFDLDGNFIKEWKSATHAHREGGIGQGEIRRVCMGIFKQHKGFLWQYR